MTKAVGQSRGDDGGRSVGTVPSSDAQRLLSATVPLAGDDREQRQTARLEQAKEKTGRHQPTVIMTGRHTGLSYTPTQHQSRHQDSVRHLDNEPSRERLPRELGYGRDGSEKRVLACSEAGIRQEAEEGSVAQHRFVQDLEKVNPDENGQNDFVGLATNAFVLEMIRGITSRVGIGGPILTSSSVKMTR